MPLTVRQVTEKEADQISRSAGRRSPRNEYGDDEIPEEYQRLLEVKSLLDEVAIEEIESRNGHRPS